MSKVVAFEKLSEYFLEKVQKIKKNRDNSVD